jgi:hypothetical protein
MSKAHEVLELVVVHCRDIRSIVAISATSKLLNSICRAAVMQNREELVLATAEAFCEAQHVDWWMQNRKYEQIIVRCTDALQWLLRTARAASLGPQGMHRLLGIFCHDAPYAYKCIVPLAAAGIVPTWQQLVAAARSGQSVCHWIEELLYISQERKICVPGMTALAEAVAQTRRHGGTADSRLLQQIQQEQPSLTEFLDVLYVFVQAPRSTYLAACLL